MARHSGRLTLSTVGVAAVTVLSPPAGWCLDNGMAQTPPLAYSTLNFFNTEVNATMVSELGAALVATGLAAAGFKQFNIDSGYLAGGAGAASRGAAGELRVNATKFPAGTRAVADVRRA